MPESLFFNNFIKKEALAQVFSCEFSEISNNTFPYRTPPVADVIWGFIISFCVISISVVYSIFHVGEILYITFA